MKQVAKKFIQQQTRWGLSESEPPRIGYEQCSGRHWSVKKTTMEKSANEFDTGLNSLSAEVQELHKKLLKKKKKSKLSMTVLFIWSLQQTEN